MFPWFWIWAPQYQLPFGGSVTQRIAPETDWFFGSIPPAAGNGALEQKIHEDVASYGRQLGLLTEVLLSLASRDTVEPQQARESLARLQEIYREVEALKAREKGQLAEAAATALEQLARADPQALARVLQRFQPVQQRLLPP